MSKKNEKAGDFAEAAVAEPIQVPFDNVVPGTFKVLDVVAKAEPAEVTFEQWAELKGHIKRLPKPGRPRAAYVLPGPDYRVIKVATQWPANKVVSEDEYDEAVVKTYGAEIRER